MPTCAEACVKTTYCALSYCAVNGFDLGTKECLEVAESKVPHQVRHLSASSDTKILVSVWTIIHKGPNPRS